MKTFVANAWKFVLKILDLIWDKSEYFAKNELPKIAKKSWKFIKKMFIGTCYLLGMAVIAMADLALWELQRLRVADKNTMMTIGKGLLYGVNALLEILNFVVKNLGVVIGTAIVSFFSYISSYAGFAFGSLFGGIVGGLFLSCVGALVCFLIFSKISKVHFFAIALGWGYWFFVIFLSQGVDIAGKII